MNAKERKLKLEEALHAVDHGTPDQVERYLRSVVKCPVAETDDLGEAIAIASASDNPAFAIELLDYVEQVIKMPNPSDFSREELIRFSQKSESDHVFVGVGATERGNLCWPVYLLKKVKLTDAGIGIERKWFGIFRENLNVLWSDIREIQFREYVGWKYRAKVKIRICQLATKNHRVSIDISNVRPEIIDPEGFSIQLKKYFPGIARNVLKQ